MTSEITAALQAEEGQSDLSKAAIDLLVTKGYARDAAQDLVRNAHPPEPGSDVSSWVAAIMPDEESQSRRRVLAEHHQAGIPPLEPPPLKSDA